MVSQKAFKEIAIQLGIEAGLTRKDVTEAAKKTFKKVLDNETQHGNNFSENENDDWATFYAPRVKSKFGIE